MTDTTEPWPPVPGTGPTGYPGVPPPTTPGLPQPFVAPPPEWAQPAAPIPPTLGTPQVPVVPLPADQVGAALRQATPPRRRRGGLVVIVALIVVGLAGVLGGGGLLAKELTRKATKAEQTTALAAEIGSRWQRLPTGEIFPGTVSYQIQTSSFGIANAVQQINPNSASMAMTRIGIAPQSSCQTALAPSAFAAVRALGCVAMLRATYAVADGAQAVTVGIAVFPSTSAAQNARSALVSLNGGPGLDALPFPGTVADTFDNAARGASGVQSVGPYVLIYTVGYTDGMPGRAASANDNLQAIGTGILGALEPALTRHTSPCTMKDIKC